MRIIGEAGKSVFKLILSRNDTNKILIRTAGRISINNKILRLDYQNTRDTIGWIEDSHFIIRTLHQNVLPLFVRIVQHEVWISNDLSELVIHGEVVPVRRVELLLSAAGSQGIRTALSHLIEGITLLMPLSRYRISFQEDSPEIAWSDIDFNFHEYATKEDFLDFLIEQYKKVYSHDPEICLAISGGWDSRLELAILTHLRKKVHCYHAAISKRESVQARRVARMAGASFQQYPFEELVLRGWDFMKQKGYLTRWDGFFAPGILYSAGLYTKMKKEYPGAAVRLMSSLTGWKGRLYEHSNSIPDYWQHKEESYFKECHEIFPEYRALFMQEQERRQEIVSGLIKSISAKCVRNDIAVDISYNMLAYSRMDTRETFLVENGMPVFDGTKEAGDFFISLPEESKKQPVFIEWAIGQLNSELKNLPHTTSSMKRSEREFGLIGRVRLLNGILGRFSKIDRGYRQDWLHDTDVTGIFELIPEMRSISDRVNGDKNRLYIAQICRFLKALQEKKNVSFSIVE
ncbi:MAG: hypothetical protein WC382_08280 [Methanoregulaceae archaeon]